jgi:hypothetical protein
VAWLVGPTRQRGKGRTEGYHFGFDTGLRLASGVGLKGFPGVLFHIFLSFVLFFFYFLISFTDFAKMLQINSNHFQKFCKIHSKVLNQ